MSDTQTLTISVRNLKALVEPVLPCAADRDLPVLNAVHIKTHGQWLVAEATDRFRCAMQRQKASEGEWPAWEAVVPIRTLKAMFDMFKPTRGFDPEVSLTVDGDKVAVELTGGLAGGLFAEARVAYPVETGDYPKLGKLFADVIAAEPEAGNRRLNWNFLADFKVADPRGLGLTVHAGSPNKPMLVTDEEGFIAIIMPRKLRGAGDGPHKLDLSDWADILAPPVPVAPPETKPKAKRTRKTAEPAEVAS